MQFGVEVARGFSGSNNVEDDLCVPVTALVAKTLDQATGSFESGLFHEMPIVE
jgi:hypothetical protein